MAGLDSLISYGTTNGQLTYTGRAFFYYGANGLLTMSKSITPPTLAAGYEDSSVYQYNGTVLQKGLITGVLVVPTACYVKRNTSIQHHQIQVRSF
ncbi:MAG: hypothetical protein IPP72_13700 [Chitinophagaceae bacterium]|nr:hypothetical protein [Chitinophagaceae bacterium]